MLATLAIIKARCFLLALRSLPAYGGEIVGYAPAERRSSNEAIKLRLLLLLLYLPPA